MSRQPLSEFVDPTNSLEDAFDYIESYHTERDRAQRLQDKEQHVCPQCKRLLSITYRGTLVCHATGVGCWSFAEFISRSGELVEVQRD